MATENFAALMRNQVAHFITADAVSLDLVYLAKGVTDLSESPTAQTDSTVYISDRSASKTTTGYDLQFPFTADIMVSPTGTMEPGIKSIHDAAYFQQTGAEGERDYIIANLYEPVAGKPSTFTARKFRVSVEVATKTGAAGEKMTISGNLNAVGNPMFGTFNTKTKVFTEELTDTNIILEQEAGGDPDAVKITTIPATPQAGNSFMFLTAASVVMPEIGEVVSGGGWMTFVSGTEKESAVGWKFGVVEVDPDDRCVRKGITTVIAVGV